MIQGVLDRIQKQKTKNKRICDYLEFSTIFIEYHNTVKSFGFV